MAKVTMYQGETLIVQFSDTDGEITIDFDSRAYPNQLVVRESDGIKGNVKGGAGEILYHERFGIVNPDDVADEELSAPTIVPGFFVCSSGILRHTERVNCLVRELPGGKRIVVTLAEDGTETGEYMYYPTVAAVEAVLGKAFPRIAI